MNDETLPETPAWHNTPWSARHKKTLQNMLVDTDEHFIQEQECDAIEAALAEIARLEFALETVANIARASRHHQT